MDHNNDNFQYISSAKLPTRWGTFTIHGFFDVANNQEHIALTYGKWDSDDVVISRVHSECLTGDAFASLRCDCGAQLETAMSTIQGQGWGVLLYLRQEGRGIGLHAKIQAYHLQDRGADTLDANLMLGLPADARDYKIAASMLKALNITRVSLLTNNPDKVEQLSKYGLVVVERMPLVAGIGEDNRSYLSTKAERMGHKLSQDELQS